MYRRCLLALWLLAAPLPAATIETVAGTGQAGCSGDGTRGDGPDAGDPLQCRFARLHGLGVDPATGDLYIGDSENHQVRVIRGLGGTQK